jgi:two-component system LytT family response regulator
MNPIHRALIVDDEDDARAKLRKLLASHPEVEIVGEADSVTEAISRFHAHRPNLIFLDVQMPKRDGFSLLPELRPLPEIVFVTAYDVFAVKAFEVNAADFLLKPIQPDRLALALARLTRRAPRKAKPFAHDDRVFLYSDQEMRVVLATDISHIAAEQNYCRVHLANHEPMLVRRTMTEWKRLLPKKYFLRVNRSTLINLYAVEEILPLPNHHTTVSFVGGGSTIELSRIPSRRLRKGVGTILPL